MRLTGSYANLRGRSVRTRRAVRRLLRAHGVQALVARFEVETGLIHGHANGTAAEQVESRCGPRVS